MKTPTPKTPNTIIDGRHVIDLLLVFVFISLTGGPLSYFHTISQFYAFTCSQNIADVPGENLVQLVDEHEHVAVLFYSSLDKSTKKVKMVIK